MAEGFNNGLGHEPIQMKRFHCVYYEGADNLYSKGEDIEAVDMLSAILKFREKHDGKEPFIIHDKNLTRHGN
ncbi:MAG: hypothetical protein ACK5B9_05350 [Flavobacteriia bacterium]|jgi:hypothetical protein